VYHQKKLYAFSNQGNLLSSSDRHWTFSGQPYSEFKFIDDGENLFGIGKGFERATPFVLKQGVYRKLPPIDLPSDVYIFQGICIGPKDFWLCTQNGAYKWNTETGETKCFLPNERVSDVVRDYQGNYWFSTLDNGVFVCASLYNTLLKIYNNPLLDNFTKLQYLPNGDIVIGNSQGLLSKVNLETFENFRYNLVRDRETEFISYDTVKKVIISNRGVFKQDQKEPVEIMDYNKGVTRDRFGNLVFVVFNGAFLINDNFKGKNRSPVTDCPLYQKFKKDTLYFPGAVNAVMLRQKRGLSVLSALDKNCFWVGYEDGLYEYHYDGTTRILKEGNGEAVIAKSLLQQADGSLVVGSSTNGVMIFRNGKIVKTFTLKNGLSSLNIRKVLKDNGDIWVLTDAGVDRINAATGSITNYLEEYGLTNTIINDFVVAKGKILFATTSGILIR
jgi:ligand-binding sensor domain-containing protein